MNYLNNLNKLKFLSKKDNEKHYFIYLIFAYNITD